jgi:hypothetical protein
LEGGSPGRAAPVDIDESLASTTEEEDQQLPHNLYSPSPREQAVLEDSEFAATGQEVVVKEVAGFVGRFVSGLSLDSRNNVPLSNLIQNRRWSAVVDRIHANPLEPEEDLRVLTRGGFMANTGMTALHYACERDPPLPVVQALIEAHPMAVLTRCMPGGALPLHIACTWHCSPAVVDALVAADPGGCKMRDELGNVALHSACFSGADAAVVATLLETDPKAVVARNHQGSRPVDICQRLRHDNRKLVISLLTRKREDVISSYHHRRTPSSGGWSEIAREAEELNQR